MNIDTFINTVMTSGRPFAVRENQELGKRQRKAHRLCWEYNRTDPNDRERQQEILRDLFGTMEGPVGIMPNFQCDYGFNIHFHGFAFLNYNCVILDTAPVHIENAVFIAPGTIISCAGHAMDAEQRGKGAVGVNAPITIEDDVWIGANCTICPGVTIGKGSVIGAGSTVVRDIPPGVVAIGTPCRVHRALGPDDKVDPEDIIYLDGPSWED
ncbi:MAG: sugar O-acetyltransferase [Peptococcaceae bacterium]|nr:sugar O-acetyltransferase [Peptococcaceae bacterium]